MRSEKELNYLEEHIPELAQNATSSAYFDTLSGGDSVLESIDGKIYKTYSDGTREFVKNIGKSVSIGQRHLVIK